MNNEIDQLQEMRRALETIRDAKYTHGETQTEIINDLKAIAFNVLYELYNGIIID